MPRVMMREGLQRQTILIEVDDPPPAIVLLSSIPVGESKCFIYHFSEQEDATSDKVSEVANTLKDILVAS